MRFEHHGVLRTITILCSRHASKNSDVICVPTPSQATTALLVGERPPRAANITLSDWMMNKTAYSPVTEPFALWVARAPRGTFLAVYDGNWPQNENRGINVSGSQTEPGRCWLPQSIGSTNQSATVACSLLAYAFTHIPRPTSQGCLCPAFPVSTCSMGGVVEPGFIERYCAPLLAFNPESNWLNRNSQTIRFSLVVPERVSGKSRRQRGGGEGRGGALGKGRGGEGKGGS